MVKSPGPVQSGIDLSIVIVNWNSVEYVKACIRSVVATTHAVRYEIVVVDNASFDGCERQIRQQFPDVAFVQSEENLGFGGANNLGAEHSSGDDLLFLNPDTEVRDGAIDRLYAQFNGFQRAGMVGCRLLNTDGSLQTSCVQALPTVLNQICDLEMLRRFAPRAAFWGTHALFVDSATPVEVEAVSGACMMVHRRVFQSVGGFSPVFFMYGEDMDLCARVRRAGFRNGYAGNCEIVHHGGGSTRKKPSTFSVVMMCESVALVIRRSRGSVAAASYRVALTTAAFMRLAILGLTAPVWVLADATTSWRETWRKWVAILGWGLGLSRRAQSRHATVPAVVRG